MKINHKAALLLLSMFAALTLTTHAALAHRFSVVLVVPLSANASLLDRQFRDGFMLATAERDSHPREDSDGHLGGLDVYVEMIDGNGNPTPELRSIVAQGDVDIVVAFGTEATFSLVRRILDGKEVALLLPGRTPFARPELAAVAAFIAAYERKYGIRPLSQAAQGYNAARRIDQAVRAQGGVDDRAALRRSFKATEDNFTW